DGYDDVIIGAYHNSAGGNRAGRVYIYFGGPNPHTTPDLILTGLSPGEQFGVSVASGEDINGDGFDDLLVGANLNSGNGAYAGKAYLFFGGATISTNPDVVFNGESPGDHFGISVAMAGDINGDGFSDFLIGAGGDGTSSHAGKAYLYYGEFEPGNQPQMVFSGTPGDGYGRMVTGIRDINGDGYDDFLIGAPFHPGPNGPDLEPDAGEAYLFLGGVNLNSTPDLTLRLPPSLAVSQANFGFSATTVGDFPAPDINNFLRKDGYADFAVGAYGQITQSHTDGNGKLIVDAAAGKVHLFRGDLDLNTVSNIYASFASGNNSSNEFFSDSLSSPGDMNGDGFDDLIVGAMTADQTKGRAYYYNGYTLSNSLLCSTCALFGIYTLEGFGFAVK
ncbi:MAG: FG-GAP repeat protein, partial [Nitrospirae bacterium]|nr:FG-GAP repeat protein [Nitrospirota bacterium]